MSWSHIPFNSLSSYGHALSLFSFSSFLIPSRRMPIVLETFTGEKIFRSVVLATKRAQAGFIGSDFVSLPSQGTLS